MRKTKFLLKLIFSFALLFVIFLLPNQKVWAAGKDENEKFSYLSDLSYESGSTVGWGSITFDRNLDSSKNNGMITLMVNGQKKSFYKGISAHANSQVIFDVSQYDYFSTYYGVDEGRGNVGTAVWFKFCTMAEGQDYWSQEGSNSSDKKGNTEAGFVTIDVRGKKYLKLEAYGRRGIDSAHACYGDAKVWKEGYEPGEATTVDFIKTVAEYDKILKRYEGQEITGEYEKVLLQREFVNNAGYDLLQFLATYKNAYKETLQWLMNDLDNLRLYVLGGYPDGKNYKKSIMILSDLRAKYGNDFIKQEPTKYGYDTLGNLYKRMAVALSLTHTVDVALWMQPGNAENKSDPVRRYQIYKDLYHNGNMRFTDQIDFAKWFERYTTEEMRYVMNCIIDDQEILWLNEYTQSFIDANSNKMWYLSPHPYMKYIWPNYNQPKYWDEKNKEAYDKKYKGIFSKYGVEYGKPGVYKLWMNIEGGAVCGGISKQGACNRGAHGVPATVVGQPGHAAFAYYSMNDAGDGAWTLNNVITNWGQTGKTERLGVRMPLGWGSDRYVSGYAASYLLLSQAAMNQEEAYEKSEKVIMTADLHKNDPAKQEEIYRKALQELPINVDAWYGLINNYSANETKTEKDWYDLAEEMAESLRCYPLPMYNLTNLIKPKLTSAEYSAQFVILQKRILEYGKVLANNSTETYQPSVTREVSTYLLGQMDTSIATFSFDGDDAGKIVLAERFKEMGIRWDYCINGDTQNKASWKEHSFEAGEEHKWQLTQEELASLTAENDIYIHLVGVNYDEKNLYKIDILPSAGLPSTLYANDLENKLIASVPGMEWKLNENDQWTLYKDAEPDLTGNKTVTVRMAATGTHLVGETAQYQFTQDKVNNQRTYIPIAHLEMAGYSTQSKDNKRPYYAENAIDGNGNTLWHTDFNQNVLQQTTKPFISIKLDEPKNISSLEFIQKKYPGRPQDPDDIKNARAYVSMDGETWIQAGKIENCDTYGNLYAINFEKPVYGQYVKIEMDTKNMFASLAMVNLFEDTTVVTLGTFSFDGENAGKIMITDEFKGSRWQYSLDGGTTWKNGTVNEQQLTAKEISQINSNNKIKLRLINTNKESTIDIQRQELPVITAYLNDLENRLIGIGDTTKFEWRTGTNTGNWTSYSKQEPIVAGDTKLFIRKKATSTLMASEAVEFTFTADNQPNTAKYVPIKHITSVNASNTTVPSRGEEAEYAVDGLPTTMWHSNRTTATMHDPRWIVLELDEPRYISKIEYVRKAGYAYGIPKNGKVLVSMDGENWTEVLDFKNLYNVTTAAELTASEDRKELQLSKIEKAKYVKIECTKSCDSVHGDRDGEPMDYFFSCSMINLFEDKTKVTIPTAEIQYSTTETTNQNVTATLVNKSTDITVTNNDGKDTYTFTENGEFTFEFKDNKGTKGTATAKVDWIVKTLPTPSITYTPNSLTNQDVTATVTFDREGTKIIDENGQVIENGNTHVFTENGKHEFRFRGPYGNIGKTTATVDWIDKKAPVATIQYSSTNLSNQDVIATVTFDEENVTVKDGNTHTFTANGDYTFEFADAAGNKGTLTANVTWIDKDLPTATVTYSTTKLTNKDVTATVTFDREGVKIVDEQGQVIEGGNEYTFIENETHEFHFVEPVAGKRGVTVAKVDWIDKVPPVATITYDINKLTNQNVTATITFNEEDVRITNNEGKDTYTFEMNGEFEFEFVDKVGNIGKATAEVGWIDKRQINATITYDINDITNQDVTATITFDKENVMVEGGNTYTFAKNGRHEFRFVGPAGNTGTAVAEVTWIDKVPPVATITYDTKELTNKDVTATVTFDEDGVSIVNDKGESIKNGNTHVFTKNGNYTFHYVDSLGNKGTALATVNWIDKTEPTAKIEYSTTEPTNGEVIARLVNASEPITITNNNGSDTYTFAKNGEFKFEFVDQVGNKGSITAKVNWIKDSSKDPEKPDEPVKPDDPTKPDDPEKPDNPTKPDDPVKPNDPTKPDEYKIGDVNGDGKITATDILFVKRHLVAAKKQEWILTGLKFKAGDINKDGKITATDLLLIKRLVLSEMKK